MVTRDQLSLEILERMIALAASDPTAVERLMKE